MLSNDEFLEENNRTSHPSSCRINHSCLYRKPMIQKAIRYRKGLLLHFKTLSILASSNSAQDSHILHTNLEYIWKDKGRLPTRWIPGDVLQVCRNRITSLVLWWSKLRIYSNSSYISERLLWDWSFCALKKEKKKHKPTTPQYWLWWWYATTEQNVVLSFQADEVRDFPSAVK